MKKVTILKRISHRKNSRYLVFDGEQYMELLTSINLSVGDEYTIDENLLSEASLGHVEQYKQQSVFSTQDVIEHLTRYKHNILEDFTCGTYEGKEYEHVLNEAVNNLLLGFGFDLELKSEYSKILKHHKGFANLTSSQAFAVNFFTPLVHMGRLDLLGFYDNSVQEYQFEKELSTKEQTEFDFFIQLKEGKSISFEVKYTEDSFGKTRDNSSHSHKFDAIYKNLLNELTINTLADKSFFSMYQFWRNVSYVISSEGRQDVCFVYPSYRHDFDECINTGLLACKKEYRHQIHIIHADMVAEKAINSNDQRLSNYFKAFKHKYIDIRYY